MLNQLNESDQKAINTVLRNGFRNPQPEVCISGFPMTFRRTIIDGDVIMWTPRGFSRHGKVHAWRFKRAHSRGSVRAYCSDNLDDPETSLKRLWVKACTMLAGLDCPTTSLKAPLSSGRTRDPVLDTGITGVSIQQRRCPSSREFSVFIATLQRLKRQDGDHDSHYECIRNFSAKKFYQAPEGEQAEFDDALTLAAMVRYEYNQRVSNGQRPCEPITPEHLSQNTLAQKAWIKNHLKPVRLEAIFSRQAQIKRLRA